jgi:hypothetical protein
VTLVWIIIVKWAGNQSVQELLSIAAWIRNKWVCPAHQEMRYGRNASWFVTPRGLVGWYQRFGVTYCFHVQDLRQYVHPKRWYLPTSPHSVTIQKTNINTSVLKTWNEVHNLEHQECAGGSWEPLHNFWVIIELFVIVTENIKLYERHSNIEISVHTVHISYFQMPKRKRKCRFLVRAPC